MSTHLDKFDLQLALEGVVIKRSHYASYQRAIKVTEQTKKYVRETMKSVHQEAQQIQDLSYQVGFEQGFLAVLQHFKDFILHKNNLLHEIQHQVTSHIEAVLINFFNNDDVIIDIFKQTLQQHDFTHFIGKTQILLPAEKKHAHTLTKALTELIDSHDLEIDFHDDMRYIIKNDQQLFEFELHEKINYLQSKASHHKVLYERVELLKKQVLSDLFNQSHTV